MTTAAGVLNQGQCVALLPATERDGNVTRRLLMAEGIGCRLHARLDGLASDIRDGIGVLVLMDAALLQPAFDVVLRALDEQEAWSDIPLVVMTSSSSPALDSVLDKLHNVTLLDRPTTVRGLLGAIKAALRAREKQFEIRRQLQALGEADDALRAADRRKDEFLATLAHELRNPLAPMRSALQILQRGLERQDRGRLLAIMDRQMNVMVRLIDDLLDVARISSGKVVLQRERLDLRRVIDMAVESTAPALVAAGHQLHVRSPDEPVWVLGDAIRLAQVVSNLLNNAIKYTPGGGCVELRLASAEGMAVVTVADNGAGIPAELLARVFDLFAQVNRTLDRSQGGLGIGLSLVQRLVDMHGGTVAATSGGIDAGSRFIVTLPAIEVPGPDGMPRRVADAATHRHGQRVLVIDDNRDAADMLSMLISADGHDTRTEYGGEAGLARAEEFRPRVVFCDIGMPQLNGLQVAARLRSNPLHATTVLVAVSGWGTDDDKRASRLAGFDVHLTKPLQFEMLEAVFGRL